MHVHEKRIKSRAEHDKWLMKMGAHPMRSKTRPTGINKIP